jgi:uncharacterized protein YydD (DUF2326 family)
MKISKLYSNNKNFKNVTFNLNGLNVVYADVTTKANEKKTSHSIGKTKFAELIDFLLLKQTKKDDWLNKINQSNELPYFEDYTFYMEILLNGGKYLTIKRQVNENTKIEFSVNDDSTDGYNPPENFKIKPSSFSDAKNILNNFLDINLFMDKKYDYRKGLSYCLRTPTSDYNDVYKLNKFQGKDKD